MQKKIFFPFLCSLLLAGAAIAQPPGDKTELERERQELQKELKEMQGVYDKVKGQSKQALGQLSVLNRKINLQERYINSISKEIRMIDDDLYLSNLEIYRLQKQLDTLKTEYSKSLVYAYKNRSSYDYLNFIFSATSFNDAIKRVSYLKSYRTYRENQAKTILDTKEEIAKRQKQQISRKDQKNVALQSQTKEKAELDVQKKEKDVVVKNLKSQEKDLQKQINAKKKRDNDLKNAIAAIIRREIEKEKELARIKAEEEKKKNPTVVKTEPKANNPTATTTNPTSRVATSNSGSVLELNANDVKLGSDFLNSKGKLPWPVDKGYPSIHFGPYNIPETHLKGDNPGVTIATQYGASVKSVFNGEVVGVFNLGDGMAVTIRHGKYFTTYSNLSSASVKKGDAVSTGQVLGKAGRDDAGDAGQIDFILMIETKNVNPEAWLRR
ncbi:MAG TPA: peptidoglycan DD-metalloendopeptidase family protein [Chitinophagaceae bacterium]